MSQIFENQNNSEDTGRLLKILPSDLAARVESSGDLSALTEIVLDVGREPLARFGDREAPLADTEADYDLIDRISANVGEFDLDNRAGMIRTLHRISAIRNRKGRIIGLTIWIVGEVIPAEITVFSDGSFTFVLKTPPTTFLIKKASGLEKGSGLASKGKEGKITRAQIREIAETKFNDTNAVDIEGAIRQIEGSVRNMGIQIVD